MVWALHWREGGPAVGGFWQRNTSQTGDLQKGKTSRLFWQLVARGPIHLLEMLSGSRHASQTCNNFGCKIGQPIVLSSGFGLLTKAGQDAVGESIVAHKPMCVFIDPHLWE